MMVLLFEREIRPYFEYRQPPSYRTLLCRKTEPERELRSIFFGKERVGQAERLLVPVAGTGYVLRSRVAMDLRLMMPAAVAGDTQTWMASEAVVDEDFRLRQFESRGGLRGLNFTVRGTREGRKLRVAYDLLLFSGVQEVEFPPDAALSDYFLPFEGGGRLGEGKKWKSRMLDLDNLVSLQGKREVTFTEVYAVVVGREVVRALGHDRYAFKVEIRRDPTQVLPSYTLWVDDQGIVLRQEMKIQRLVCQVLLEERERVAPEKAAAYPWRVPLPR